MLNFNHSRESVITNKCFDWIASSILFAFSRSWRVSISVATILQLFSSYVFQILSLLPWKLFAADFLFGIPITLSLIISFCTEISSWKWMSPKVYRKKKAGTYSGKRCEQTRWKSFSLKDQFLRKWIVVQFFILKNCLTRNEDDFFKIHACLT